MRNIIPIGKHTDIVNKNIEKVKDKICEKEIQKSSKKQLIKEHIVNSK